MENEEFRKHGEGIMEEEKPEAARSSQKQPGAARSSQEQPGAARSSQEQPGEARSSPGSQGSPNEANGCKCSRIYSRIATVKYFRKEIESHNFMEICWGSQEQPGRVIEETSESYQGRIWEASGSHLEEQG